MLNTNQAELSTQAEFQRILANNQLQQDLGRALAMLTASKGLIADWDGNATLYIPLLGGGVFEIPMMLLTPNVFKSQQELSSVSTSSVTQSHE